MVNIQKISNANVMLKVGLIIRKMLSGMIKLFIRQSHLATFEKIVFLFYNATLKTKYLKLHRNYRSASKDLFS